MSGRDWTRNAGANSTSASLCNTVPGPSLGLLLLLIPEVVGVTFRLRRDMGIR